MKLERRRLLLLIAGGVAVVLLALMIVLSVMTGGATEADAETEPSVAPSATPSPSAGSEVPEAAPIGDPDAEGAPPPNMYENSYVGDEGYEPLPENFNVSESGESGTVYDEAWATSTMQRLACELSTKMTATPRAIQPFVDFRDDMNSVPYGSGPYMVEQINRWILYFQMNEGERVDASMSDELLATCEYVDSGIGHDHEVGTEYFEGDGHDHGTEEVQE